MTMNIQSVDSGCCGGGGCGCGADSAVQAENIAGAVRAHYGKVAEQAGEHKTNSCGVADIIYDADELAGLNDEAQFASAGCGNPVGLSEIKAGETVLDLGSGGGIDCFLAAQATGASGEVIGVDVTPEMVDLARANAKKMGVNNVVFKLGKLENLPQPDDSVDLIISNCVLSLVEHKDLAFQEIFRVLKPGGRFVISDMVSDETLPDETRASMTDWVACIGGADSEKTFLERIAQAGFTKTELIAERPVTEKELPNGEAPRRIKSVTIKAFKPQ